MDNPDTLEILGTQDTRQRQTNQNYKDNKPEVFVTHLATYWTDKKHNTKLLMFKRN